jgi:formamidopyrimidine-DNA glycosylase
MKLIYTFQTTTPLEKVLSASESKESRDVPQKAPRLGLSQQQPRWWCVARTSQKGPRKAEMPELPEVDAARLLIARHCMGKRITQVLPLESGGGPRTGKFDEIVLGGKGGTAATPASFAAALTGRTLLSSERRGKIQFWRLSAPAAGAGGGSSSSSSSSSSSAAAGSLALTTHFGMTGAWALHGQPGAKLKRYSVDASVWPPRFTKVEIAFDDGTRLALCDPRRLARMTLVADPLADAPIGELGPDALLALPPLRDFAAMLARRAVAIKALLLDQHVIAGIGNWIADEVLYQARVHPESAASALDAADVQRLREAIVSVLAFAIKVEADNEKFPRDWLFHYRWGKGQGKSVDCAGHAIEFVTVGGRTSAVVKAVQGSPKRGAVGTVAGGAGAGSETDFAREEEGDEEEGGRAAAAPKKAALKARKASAAPAAAAAEAPAAAVASAPAEGAAPMPRKAAGKARKAAAPAAASADTPAPAAAVAFAPTDGAAPKPRKVAGKAAAPAAAAAAAPKAEEAAAPKAEEAAAPMPRRAAAKRKAEAAPEPAAAAAAAAPRGKQRLA